MLLSCEGNNKLSVDDKKDLEAAIGNAGYPDSDSGPAGGNKCLLQYQQQYDQLLSEADVLTLTGFSKSVMSTDYAKVMKPEHHSFKFTFANKRIGKVKGIDHELELKDMVAVAGIKAMSLKQFKESYRIVTEEEIKLAKEALDNVVDGKSGNKDAEKAMEKATEHKVSKETIKNTGNDILGIIKEVSAANTVVTGLGDAAVWNFVSNDLFVLHKGVKFEVKVDIGSDGEKNKTIALQLANIILNKCP